MLLSVAVIVCLFLSLFSFLCEWGRVISLWLFCDGVIPVNVYAPGREFFEGGSYSYGKSVLTVVAGPLTAKASLLESS